MAAQPAAFQIPVKALRLILTPLAIAMALAFAARTAVRIYAIPSHSMEPTLQAGDRIVVTPYHGVPQRGDVVVFRLPKDPSVEYIKRVIGLPGDKIQVIDGQVHINGTAIKREPAPPFIETEEGTREAPIKRWKETLPDGKSYYTLDLVDNGFADNTQVYTVPPGDYFMMGDNRDNSTDSRFSQVGFVPLQNIVGKAQLIFFSVYDGERAWEFWRWPWSVRWTRLFTIVR